MKAQTMQRSINVSSVIREIKYSSINHSPRLSPTKAFPYMELYQNSTQKPQVISPNNLSRLLTNLHSKINRKQLQPTYNHELTYKYPNSKVLNNNFIEKVRMELEAKVPLKAKHKRSCSEVAKKSKRFISKPNVELNDLVVLPAPHFPASVKHHTRRKESHPECAIDFHRIDMPYVRKYLNSGYFNDLDDLIETKDVSMNT